ncbi:hypothetical protein FB45DRAFT_1011922 [Roridomyces roridus]|uniref:Uncharacterized protein n=1 Tax=Roridomyces roridus TaxID=1738132 RepID=A0AAD7B0C4_9AGAR|nr:hypothetical protein FB45DRAFT_1011922 [Roridomyces roridus]
MASQPQPLTALSARPLHQKLIDELKAIAPLMEIEPTGLKKPELLREIQQRMREKPQLAENPLLLPLFAHRTSAKSNGKNSADKAEEDDTETLNVAQAASGTNKTLLENKVKTDPPAQFARLENAAGGTQATDGTSESDAAVDDDLEPVPTATAPSSPESERKVPVQDGVETVIKSLDVHLSFYHPNDPRIVPRSVVLDDFPVVRSKGPEADRAPSSAILQDSPIKDNGGRIYRANVKGEAGHHHLGKVDALFKKTATSLRTSLMNTFPLNYQTHPNGDFLSGSLFYEPHTSAQQADETKETVDSGSDKPKDETVSSVNGEQEGDVKGDSDVKPEGAGASGENKAPADVKVATTEPKQTEPLNFTGAGADVPLDIAKDRASRNPLDKHTTPADREAFVDHLRVTIKAAVPGLPDTWIRSGWRPLEHGGKRKSCCPVGNRRNPMDFTANSTGFQRD